MLNTAPSSDRSFVDFKWTTVVEGVQGSLILLPELEWDSPAVAAYAASVNSPLLRIPAGRLISGKAYTMVLTATPRQDATLAVSTSIELDVAPANLEVIISGGSRIASSETAVGFAAMAWDPSETVQANGSPQPFVYTWSLEALTSEASVMPAAQPALTPSPTADNNFGQNFTLPANSLAAGSYAVHVSIARAPSALGRVGVVASVQLNVTSESVTPLVISSATNATLMGLQTQFDASKQLKLHCDDASDPTSEATVEWEVRDARTDQMIDAWTTSPSGSLLSVAAGQLGPGKLYTFTCKTSSGQGLSQVTVTVRPGPTGGTVNIISTAQSDTFIVEASGFVSSIPGGVLAYEYRYMKEGSLQELPLRERTLDSSVTFTFPQGAITPVVYIMEEDTRASGPTDTPSGVRRQLATITSVPTVARRHLLQV